MSLYTISSGTLPLASDVQQLVDVFNGKHDIGTVTFAPVIALPVLGAASAAASAGAGLSVGVYGYVLTYRTGYRKTNGAMNYAGETTQTAALTVTTTGPNSRVTLSSLPTSWPASAVGLAIYRTTVGGATYKLVTVLTTPTASYIDSMADGSLGAAVPVTNTTGTAITLPADPTTALGAATKQYVDNAAIGSLVYAYKNFGGF